MQSSSSFQIIKFKKSGLFESYKTYVTLQLNTPHSAFSRISKAKMNPRKGIKSMNMTRKIQFSLCANFFLPIDNLPSIDCSRRRHSLGFFCKFAWRVSSSPLKDISPNIDSYRKAKTWDFNAMFIKFQAQNRWHIDWRLKDTLWIKTCTDVLCQFFYTFRNRWIHFKCFYFIKSKTFVCGYLRKPFEPQKRYYQF